VTAFGENYQLAQKRAYEILANVKFDGAQYRSDIAWRAINRK
jgi:phosphoribosylamine--glycine ligase